MPLTRAIIGLQRVHQMSTCAACWTQIALKWVSLDKKEQKTMSSLEKTRCGEVAPLSPTLFCPKCNTLKPRADFKRILSRAQAKQVGYSGERRVPITSSLCKACRPKRKPAAKLTRKELINRIQGGDIHPFVGKAMLTKKQEQSRAKMSRAIRMAWEEARQATWATPMRELQQESRRFQSVRDYRLYAGPMSLFHFSVTYLSMLERIKTYMVRCKRPRYNPFTSTRAPHTPPSVHDYTTPTAPHTDWQDYASTEVRDNVISAWERVPEEDRRKLRHHPALITFRPEHRRAAPAAPLRPAAKERSRPMSE